MKSSKPIHPKDGSDLDISAYPLNTEFEYLEQNDLTPSVILLPTVLVQEAIRATCHRERNQALLVSTFDKVCRLAKEIMPDHPHYVTVAIQAVSVGFVPCDEEIISHNHFDQFSARQRIKMTNEHLAGAVGSSVMFKSQPSYAEAVVGAIWNMPWYGLWTPADRPTVEKTAK